MSAALPLTLHATAKVNLYLHVTGKRADGYHLLDSLVAFPRDVHDDITIGPAEDFSLTIKGPFSTVLGAEDLETNLVIKAVKAFTVATGHNPKVRITLTKNIPLGAGLGGGSADAAATIRGLEQFTGITLPDNDRERILLQLGADVPVCDKDYPCRFRGIGEQIGKAIELPSLFILLVWPGKPSFTKDVFARYKQISLPALPDTLPFFQNKDDFLTFLNTTQNSLQDPAESICSVIREARDFMQAQQGCLFSRMTGSGASVFGLFDSEKLAQAAQNQVNHAHPDWWSRSSAL